MTELEQFIDERIPLNTVEKEAFLKAFETRSIEKNEFLLRPNQNAKYLYFIHSGVLRTYTETESKEITTWIYKPGMFITSWHSFLGQQASFEYIQALQDSTLWAIHTERLNELYDRYPKIDRFGRYMAEEQLSFLDYFSRGYHFMSAREKYDVLLSYFPDITLHVKLGHVASMLGITLETLSRIRAK